MSTTPGPGTSPVRAGARLGRPGSEFGDHFGAPDADGAVQGQLGPDPVPQPVRDLLGMSEHADRPDDVEEGLVEADRLDHRRDIGQYPVQFAADLGVAPVTAGKEDGLGAQLAGPDRRHGRVHTEGPRLVGTGGHDPSGTGPADYDGQTRQGGIVEHLDGSEEGVHVDMQNGGDRGGLTHRG